MAQIGDRFRPGQTVPVSGFYQCDASCSHQWSTDVAGHTFPPLPADCRGAYWVLKTPRP